MLAFYEAQHAKSTCYISISSVSLYMDWAFMFLLNNICCFYYPLLNIQGLKEMETPVAGLSEPQEEIQIHSENLLI